MVKHGGGVIVFLTGSPAKPHGPGTAGIGAAFGAIENRTRTMAIELGVSGIRVVCNADRRQSRQPQIRDSVEAMGTTLNMSPQ
jgi:hypothetical protein